MHATRRSLLLIILPLLAGLGSGCDSEVVLNANLDQIPSGFIAGEVELAGDPDGDSVYADPLPNGRGFWAPLVKGSAGLLFVDGICANDPCGSGHPFAYFEPAELDANQQQNPFTWVIGAEAHFNSPCELVVNFRTGHFQSAAKLRIVRSPGNSTGQIYLDHGGGTELLRDIESGDSFGYAVRVDPSTGTVDLFGTESINDAPTLTQSIGPERQITMHYANEVAGGCWLNFNGVEGHAEN